MSRLQPQVQRVIKSHNVSAYEAQLILKKFLKDQKKSNQDVVDSHISDDDPYREGEEDVLGFGHEDDDVGKFEDIQRRLNGILISLSGRQKKIPSVPAHMTPNDDITDHLAGEPKSPTKVEDMNQTPKSKKEIKSLEKARRKAEEKARKHAEKEAKKAAKAQQKAEKKAAKAERKLAKKRKSKELDDDPNRSAKRTKKEEE